MPSSRVEGSASRADPMSGIRHDAWHERAGRNESGRPSSIGVECSGFATDIALPGTGGPVAGALRLACGDVAQLGERSVRNAEVAGSIPVISTIPSSFIHSFLLLLCPHAFGASVVQIVGASVVQIVGASVVSLVDASVALMVVHPSLRRSTHPSFPRFMEV